MAGKVFKLITILRYTATRTCNDILNTSIGYMAMYKILTKRWSLQIHREHNLLHLFILLYRRYVPIFYFVFGLVVNAITHWLAAFFQFHFLDSDFCSLGWDSPFIDSLSVHYGMCWMGYKKFLC